MLNATDWEVIDDGSWNGLRKWIRSSDEDHGTVQVKYEDVGGAAAIIEQNRQAAEVNKRDDMWHVGKIPAKVIYDWMINHGVNLFDPNHKGGVKRLLNDPDYRYLRPGFQNIIL